MANREVRWHKLLSRDDVDLTTIAQVDLIFYELARQAGYSHQEFLFTYVRDRVFTHYVNIDFKAVGRFIYKKYFNSRRQIIRCYRRGLDLIRQAQKSAATWQKRLRQSSSAANLLGALADFDLSWQEISYVYSIKSWTGIESWQADFDEMVGRLIKKRHLASERERIIFSVYQPWRPTALMEIQAKLARNYDFASLVKEYQFLRSWSPIWYKPLDAKWFKSLKKVKRDEIFPVYSLRRLNRLLGANAAERKQLALAPYMVFFKDWRDDVRRLQVYSWSFLFDSISRRYKINRDDLGYLTVAEIRQAVAQDHVDRRLIQARKRGAVVTGRQDKIGIKVLNSPLPARYRNIVARVNKESAGGLIKGLVAQKGRVKGPVRIIRSYHDIKHVQNGDILIANTTHPNYLPAMQRAAAFVTNEGGIISHAAIVAREMKKPCLVGTGNATKILSNGMMVEVDADKGLVRIL
jgi:phosphohistidine swiveling domain-containing protein